MGLFSDLIIIIRRNLQIPESNNGQVQPTKRKTHIKSSNLYLQTLHELDVLQRSKDVHSAKLDSTQVSKATYLALAC